MSAVMSPPSWSGVKLSIPINGYALLHLGESIPDVPYVMVGQRLTGDDAEELGYREFAKYGGWLIWHQRGEDFYVIDIDEPRAILPLDDLAVPQ